MSFLRPVLQVVPGRRHVTLAIAATIGLAMLGGCRQYLEREDVISLNGGDAVAANKAMHTVDPWPPEAFKKHHNTSGKRLVVGREHYDAGPPKKGDDLVVKTK